MAFDPITLEVLRNALQSAAEEMGATLTRTALSPNIKDRRDCSTAIYTRDGLLVAQAEHIPLHLGLMPTVVKAVLREYPLGLLGEGDAVIINDPCISGSHLADICIISPVYHEGEPLALVANLAHHVDVGGSVPGSISTTSREIFQEGIRIPPVKIRSGGLLNQELLKVLSTNVRTAREFYGDIHAQIAANNAGEKRLKELAGKYGAGMLMEYMEEIINYSERRMRCALAGLPQGTFTFEDYCISFISMFTQDFFVLFFEPINPQTDVDVAPPGKTVLQVMLETDFDYWQGLKEGRSRYEVEKSKVAAEILTRLEAHYPGISAQVEMTDVATPYTFWRYTRNYRGSYEGWLMTKEAVMTRVPKTLPGLSNFYMAGQWVEPGGGIPPALYSGRNLVQILCKQDGKPFSV